LPPAPPVLSGPIWRSYRRCRLAELQYLQSLLETRPLVDDLAGGEAKEDSAVQTARDVVWALPDTAFNMQLFVNVMSGCEQTPLLSPLIDLVLAYVQLDQRVIIDHSGDFRMYVKTLSDFRLKRRVLTMATISMSTDSVTQPMSTTLLNTPSSKSLTHSMSMLTRALTGAPVRALLPSSSPFVAVHNNGVASLRVVQWHWNRRARRLFGLQGKSCGFIAQELHRVCPTAVYRPASTATDSTHTADNHHRFWHVDFAEVLRWMSTFPGITVQSVPTSQERTRA